MNVKGLLTQMKNVLNEEKQKGVNEFRQEIDGALKEFNGGGKVMSDLKEEVQEKVKPKQVVESELSIDGVKIEDYVTAGLPIPAQILQKTSFKAKDLFSENLILKKKVLELKEELVRFDKVKKVLEE